MTTDSLEQSSSLSQVLAELARVKEELDTKTKALAKYEVQVRRQTRALAAQAMEQVPITATTAEPYSTKLWYIIGNHVYDSWDVASASAQAGSSSNNIVTVYSFGQVLNVLRNKGYDHYVPRYRQDASYVNAAGQTVYRVYVNGACTKESQAGVGVYFGACNPMNISGPLPGPVQTTQRAQLAAILKAYEAIANMNNGLLYEICTDETFDVGCLVNDESENRDLIERILALRNLDACVNVSLKRSGR